MKKTLLALALSVATTTTFAQTWTLTSAPITNWSCVASSADGSRLVAAVNSGFIYTSTNSGVTWAQTSAPSELWGSIACSAWGTQFYAGIPYSRWSYRTTNSGTTWEPTVGFGISVACSGDGNKVATADGYSVNISSDSGATWTSLGPDNFPVSLNIARVSCSADGNTLAVIETWDSIPPSEIVTTPSSAWVGNEVFAVGDQLCTSIAMSANGSRIVASANNFPEPHPANCGGMLFSSLNSGGAAATKCTTVTNWTSVASSADGARLVAVAGDGSIYISADGGVNWEPINAPNANWSGVASSADGSKLVAVANGGGIYTRQTTPRPALNITSSGNGLLVSWVIPSMNFQLQENSDLATTNWTDVVIAPVLNFTNLQNQVTFPLANANRFYRLQGAAN